MAPARWAAMPAAAIATGNTLEALLGAWLLARLPTFVGIGVIVAALAAAVHPQAVGGHRHHHQQARQHAGNEQVVERFPFGMGWYLLPRVLETIRPWSTTALYDMVLRVPEVLEKARHHRRAAILLTDGVDNASEITADEAMAVEREGHAVRVVEGHADNLKVTRPEDLALAVPGDAEGQVHRLVLDDPAVLVPDLHP